MCLSLCCISFLKTCHLQSLALVVAIMLLPGNFVSCSTLLGRDVRACENLIGRTWRQNCKVWLFHLKSRVEEKVSQILTFFYFVIDESARALVVASVLLPGIWFLVFSFVKRVEAMGKKRQG